MKNIKYFSTLLFLLMLAQSSFAQVSLDNGRPAGVEPAPTIEAPVAPSNLNSGLVNGSDQDDPNAEIPEAGSDIFYPTVVDELLASASAIEVAERINELTDLIDELKRSSEELRLENQIIRESLGNCCSNSALGLSASDAYLIQNAPNPFNEMAQIRYFVPGGLDDVEIRIADVKGDLLDSFEVTEAGYGKLEIAASNLTTGSFIYMITVKGEVIDSKVMIVTQ